MGSTRVARRAGKNPAKAITIARATTATVKEEISPGPNPKSWLEIAREAAYDKGSPKHKILEERAESRFGFRILEKHIF
jgi:hypothetical protein